MKIINLQFLILLFLISANGLFGQTNTLNYDIIRNDKVIGALKLQKREDGNRTYLNLTSEVNVSLIINMSVKIKEHTIYQNNKLIYSDSKRIVNDNQKLNNKTSLVNGIYYANNDGESKIIPLSVISYNTLLLYFNEPNFIKELYSESYQKMIKINKLAPEHYLITLPDGGNNEYFYKDGKCIQVTIKNTFFKVEMRLKSDIK